MSKLLSGLALLIALAVAASLSLAASATQYQFTGTITEVDTKGRAVKVDKGGDVWEFSTEGLKDLKLKKGDKVTVSYQMIAKKIEAK
jgi:hypothetical protein